MCIRDSLCAGRPRGRQQALDHLEVRVQPGGAVDDEHVVLGRRGGQPGHLRDVGDGRARRAPQTVDDLGRLRAAQLGACLLYTSRCV